MDKVLHFTSRSIPDSVTGPDNTVGLMRLHTDEEHRFLIDVTTVDGSEGAGIYLDREARKELISILLKTL